MLRLRCSQKVPYGVCVEKGQSYFWCTCGLSQNQPFCDGMHKGSGFKSHCFTAEASGQVWLCGCKQTQSPPFCDGTHKGYFFQKIWKRIRETFFLFFVPCLFLGACSSIDEERIKCPKTVIVAELLKTVEVQKGIPIRTELDSFTSSCTREDDIIIMDLRLRLTSLRPFTTVDTSLTTKPSYFVAVVDAKGNVLSRTHHEAELTFDAKQVVAVSFQRLQERLSSPDVTVYLGFNLDEAQVTSLQNTRDRVSAKKGKACKG